MFYEPSKNDHGLARNPFNSLVVPRPIGWISSRDEAGVLNLAPYSFFNAVCYKPPTVMFSGGVGSAADGMKDSIRNIEATKEFVCNLASWELREQMNASSASVSSEVDEFKLSGLTPVASNLIGAPRIKESPVSLECRYIKSVEIPSWEPSDKFIMILGEVIGVHIDDEFITEEGLVDVVRMSPIGRMGYNDYSRVDEDNLFEMERPK
ncbi:MAG: flavin reductase family protein [Gammaproteobacteria bacterium]|jgi:flavin reductase (DIM6/NTAB) family NADH-FMN oxidoreductase RutF|nr:flavin reductase family protein [Gammaproteobacteria bacterium]MBT3860320.1 flavin reductase family protein [Gammaproteobacteria bacterium]MBT3987612.1 flavin reductase family protein [Gammaproteobacteria bacterium]MBT4256838.1 flavin reductase family protein [Gammaproteobacteria bacterium]MBT4582232.1 flavin reductase family protein [Gammaproteobacteria bacterium]